jgi:SOS-response transcriptional repressor LexA/DNA-binding XRE family transcriptional regulator
MKMIGKIIKRLREKHGVTQEVLGKAIGLTTSMIGMYETSARKPSYESLTKIADYFHVSADYMLFSFEKLRLTRVIQKAMAGKTIEEFARDAGIDEKYLARLCEGNITEPPSPDILKKISDNSNAILADDYYFELMVAADYLDEAVAARMRFEDTKKRLEGRIKEIPFEPLSVGKLTKISIIGTVTAGPNGLAYEDYQGEEWVEAEKVSGGKYFYLRIKGDSMQGDGILPGDLALVRETPEVEYGALAIVIINGEEGTIKRVYKNEDSIILQASNPNYPPRVFVKEEMENVRIIGEVKMTVRHY